jgi:hypothetical protein
MANRSARAGRTEIHVQMEIRGAEPSPRAIGLGRRRTRTEVGRLRAQAERRRLRANAFVAVSLVGLCALVAFFYQMLLR